MERVIPDLTRPILIPLLGNWGLNIKEDKVTPEIYTSKIKEFERNCEKSLIQTFGYLNVQASVKTDPYSLPYNNEEAVRLYGESYLNGPYEFHRVANKIVKTILNKDLSSFRFYLFVNVVTNDSSTFMLSKMFGWVEYSFRYHIKNIKN